MLELTELEPPTPTAEEVRVRVHATSLNASDHELLTGKPLYGRITGLFRPGVEVLGSDVAGTVDAVGEAVTTFRAGDEVFGDLFGTFGGFAEWVCAPASKLTAKPASITFEQAAALPQSGLIALQGIRDVGRLEAGQRVLVNGAGGGGGSFAVQLAKHLGAADVTGVDSAEKLALLRALGADRIVDYATHDITREAGAYDLILDLVGHHSIWGFRRILAPGGRYLLVGGPMSSLLQSLMLGPLISLGGKKMGLLFHQPNQGLDDLLALVESGAITPTIDTTFPLHETAAALRYLGEGHAKGKVVITVEA